MIPIEAILRRLEQVRRQGGLRISIEEAQRRDHLASLGRLSETKSDGSWVLRHRPPLIQRLPDDDPSRAGLGEMYHVYVRSLAPERRVLVENVRAPHRRRSRHLITTWQGGLRLGG